MMNELTIKSKAGDVYNFWMPAGGGYVRLVSKKRPGTLGDQICQGGGTSGSTITATPATFEKVCRRWYRAHLARRKMGGE